MIECDDGRLRHIANGAIQPKPTLPMLTVWGLFLMGLVRDRRTQADQAAIEQIFVAKSAASALRLGMARGVGLLVCGQWAWLAKYQPERKKAVAGTGAADKKQVQDMVPSLAVTAKMRTRRMLAIAIAAVMMLANCRCRGRSGKVKPLPAYSAIAAAIARDDVSNGGKT